MRNACAASFAAYNQSDGIRVEEGGGMRRIARLITLSLSAMAFDAFAAADAGTECTDTMEQRMIACSFCHGKQGEGHRQNEYYPRIAGKPSEYLYRQLVNFRDGRRAYPQMVYMSRYLSD